VDGDRRAKWQYIIDHLPAYPTEQANGKTTFRAAENSAGNVRGWGMLSVWPSGQIGLGSDAKLLAIAHDSIRGYSNHPLTAPALARLGYDPGKLLDGMRGHCLTNGYPNAYIFFQGGGVETASTIPAAINEMLMQSHEGLLRLFPVWPKSNDARFTRLRAYGAFLVSSELAAGLVKSVTLESEKGRDCTVLNPWPGKTVVVMRNGQKSAQVAGTQFTLKTSAGERIELRAK
jgi:alpha-L-fucosidase 2